VLSFGQFTEANLDPFKVLKRFARRQKVDLNMHIVSKVPGNKGGWHIGWIGHQRDYDSKKSLAQKGAGKKVLAAVAKKADQEGKKVSLYPINKTVAKKVYKPAGYKRGNLFNRIFRDDDYLYRKPK
jgi:hypothetical protein